MQENVCTAKLTHRTEQKKPHPTNLIFAYKWHLKDLPFDWKFLANSAEELSFCILVFCTQLKLDRALVWWFNILEWNVPHLWSTKPSNFQSLRYYSQRNSFKDIYMIICCLPSTFRFFTTTRKQQLPFLFNPVPLLLCKVVGLILATSRCFLTVTAQTLLQGCHQCRKQQTFLYCSTHHSWATPGDRAVSSWGDICHPQKAKLSLG